MARLRVRACELDLRMLRAIAEAFKDREVLNSLPPAFDVAHREVAVELATRQLQHLKLQYSIVRQVEPSRPDPGLKVLDSLVQKLIVAWSTSQFSSRNS